MSPQTLVFCNRRRAFDERKNSSLSLSRVRVQILYSPFFNFSSHLCFSSIEFPWNFYSRGFLSFVYTFRLCTFSPPPKLDRCCSRLVVDSLFYILIVVLKYRRTLFLLFNFRQFEREREREKKMRRTSFKKKILVPFCRCVRPRDFCDFFSLSTALSTTRRGRKIRPAERDGRSLSSIRVQPTKSTPKRSH